MFLHPFQQEAASTRNNIIRDVVKIYSVCKYVVVFSRYEGDVYFGSLEQMPEALLDKTFSAVRMDQTTLYIQL
jgi:hypothetical protein